MRTAIRRYTGQGFKPSQRPQDARMDAERLMPGTYVAGTLLGQQSTWTAANDVQTLTVTGTPTGGNFYLNFNGDIIGPVAFNASVAAIQALFDASPQLGAANVVVSGAGALPGNPITFTFSGPDVKNLWIPLITVQSSALTGGAAPAAAVVHTTEGRALGGMYGRYDDTLTDGRQVAKRILALAATVDVYGRATVGGGEWGEKLLTVPVYVSGVFRTADITGIDAAAVVDLNANYISGDATKLTDIGTEINIP